MAPRPAWKGYLKLSLVTCAVELSNATTQSEKVSFRVLNRTTGNTVKRQYVDSATGKPVDDKNEVKGYEVDKDEFLLVEEDEIEAVQIESSHTLSLDSFVQKSAIQQIYLDTPYYLAPADEVSEEAFAVIREALANKKMAGLARIVLYQRERPVVIEPLGKGMLLTTLRYDNTVRQPDTVFGDIKTREDRQGDDRSRDQHHRPEKGQVRSLDLRGPLRERASRPDQGEEGGAQGAGHARRAKTLQRHQPVRCAEEKP